MLRKLMLLPLALPVALFVGCEGTAQNDTATTDSALESCFSASSDGATKCALQTGGFSRDAQDIDHDGHPDAFVCAHIVKVPHGSLGAGGASGAPVTPPAANGDGPPPVPTDCDCDRMGCQDLRGQHGGAGGAGGKTDPPAAPAAPVAADTASSPAPAAGGGDMTCPGHGPQGGGQGPQGGDGGAGAGDGAGGAGAPAGHGPGAPGGGQGAGGAGVR